ncbi:MAG: penicillin-binding protein 1C [Proteobacteria bacterium]|nr:MAG: penicillin-binding protein 1C [Pseudomonadota bacterium]
MKASLKFYLMGATLSCCALGVAFVAALYALLPAIPSPSEVRSAYKSSELQVLDRNGALLQTTRIDPKRRRLNWTSLSKVTPTFVKALIISEDRRFFSHAGVDFKAVAAAAVHNAGSTKKRGASTISMQLASLLTPELRQQGRRGIFAKLCQVLGAIKLETAWSKQEILEAYINLLYYRGELQGIESAARGLFDRSPDSLSLSQSLLLAAIVPSPSAPAEKIVARGCRLSALLAQGDCASITASAAPFSLPYEMKQANLAPHLAQALRLRDRRVTRTTVDRGLQQVVIEALGSQLADLRGSNVSDGAALVVENESGEVLAYVGNIAALSSAKHIDGVRIFRQAGSTLKPFLYAAAFDERILRPDNLLEDTPYELGMGFGNYRPDNYDHQYRGAVTVREALASSLNIAAVRALNLVGVERFAAVLKEIGLTKSTDSRHYGHSLALGTSQVSLFELVNAYRTFANEGVFSDLKVHSNEEPTGKRRVFSPRTAKLVSEILSDREARSLTFGLESVLSTSFWSSVKTGTSKDMVDNWCVGYSGRYTVGVWVGNFSGAPMWNVSGLSGAAPAWQRIMSWLHRSDNEPASPVQLTRSSSARPCSGGSDLARITYPADGSIFAIDPDIPADNQRIFFEASSSAKQLHWRLNNSPVGETGRLVYWRPQPGRYLLELAGEAGEVIDTASFLVRPSY